MDRQIEWILMQKIFGFGGARFAKAMEVYHTPQALLETAVVDIMKCTVLTKNEKERFTKLDVLKEEAEKDKAKAIDIGCTILTPDSTLYPIRLKSVSDKPTVLYVLGSAAALNNFNSVAIIGTRNHTKYGEIATWNITSDLAQSGFTIISGLALGIDSFAHSATLQSKGCTIAVLGNGIGTAYPLRNKHIHQAIIDNGGAVVSEFPPDTPALPYHFPLRNRIVSGLSRGVLVVEGRKGSGTLITTAFAITQQKDVFAVPGEIYTPTAEATNWLIRQGANMVTSAEDICDHYNVKYNPSGNSHSESKDVEQVAPVKQQTAVKKKLPKKEEMLLVSAELPVIEPPVFLTEEQRGIWNVLSFTPVGADDIMEKTGLPISLILSTLTQLEIFGNIEACAGRTYKLSN